MAVSMPDKLLHTAFQPCTFLVQELRVVPRGLNPAAALERPWTHKLLASSPLAALIADQECVTGDRLCNSELHMADSELR